jgi:hypothetical protein
MVCDHDRCCTAVLLYFRAVQQPYRYGGDDLHGEKQTMLGRRRRARMASLTTDGTGLTVHGQPHTVCWSVRADDSSTPLKRSRQTRPAAWGVIGSLETIWVEPVPGALAYCHACEIVQTLIGCGRRSPS